MNEYRIPEHNLGTFTAKIDKLNKTAVKLGCQPILVTELCTEDIKERSEFTDEPTGRITRYHIITVKGEAPKLNGWAFIATLQHLPDGNIIKATPGETDLPKQYRTNKPICDHCKKDWLHRKDTFIVRNEQGKLKQIGRQCLADFLGHQSPEQIANYANRLFQLNEELDEEERLYNSYPMTSHYYDLVEYLSMTVAVIESRGWVSAKMIREGKDGISTAGEVDNQLTNRNLRESERIYSQPKHRELALKAIDWIRNDAIPKSDYEHNLVLLTKNGTFPIVNAGIVASLIAVYQREFDRREQAKDSPLANSQYVGKEGDKIQVNVNILRVLYIENGYGYRPASTAIIKMQDERGNLYTWFTQVGDMEQEQKYTIKGTVKRHQEYKGVQETVLTRCKVLTTINNA